MGLRQQFGFEQGDPVEAPEGVDEFLGELGFSGSGGKLLAAGGWLLVGWGLGLS